MYLSDSDVIMLILYGDSDWRGRSIDTMMYDIVRIHVESREHLIVYS